MQETSNAIRSRETGGGEQHAPAPLFTLRGKQAHPWLALAALCLISITSLFDAKTLQIALPSLLAVLKTDLTTVSWVVNVTSLVTAILFIPVGRFADQYGRRRLLMYGLLIFGVGSVLCALSPAVAALTGTPVVYWLIGFRVVQAIGSALHVVVLATIAALFPPGTRGRAIGVYIAWSGLMQMGTPLLVGVLISHLDWIWLFLVGLPCSLVALVLVACFVPETGDPHLSRQTDWPGIVTLSVALLCLVLSIQASAWGWTTATSLQLGGIAFAALLLFVLIERRRRNPMIDLQIFRIPSFSVSNVIACLDGLAIPGALLLLSYYLITMLGYDQVHAALILLSVSSTTLLAAALAGIFSTRIDVRLIGVVSLTLLAIGLFLLSALSLDSGEIAIIGCGVPIGAGMGLMAQSLPAIVLSEVPRAKLGAGSGVFTTCGQLCAALGVPLLLSIFLGQAQMNVTTARAQAVSLVQADTTLPKSTRAGIVTYLNGISVSGEAGVSVNLVSFANQLPAGTSVQTRKAVSTDLARLNVQLNSLFKTQTVNAYHVAWLVAALMVLAGGVMTGVILTRRRRPVPAR
jgi:EmrB/QacA subfamily drug resistance transporter